MYALVFYLAKYYITVTLGWHDSNMCVIETVLLNTTTYVLVEEYEMFVLLFLLSDLGKRDKLRGLPSILSLFCNKFNKFNKTRSRMLESIYHMTFRLL